MGGYGSGRFGEAGRPPRKATVEECFVLDVADLVRSRLIHPGARREDTWTWGPPGEGQLNLRVVADLRDPAAPAVGLCDPTAEGRVGYAVRLTTTVPRFGGSRYWLLCPLTWDGEACRRRVGKLYLPDGMPYFGCRTCYRLTYRSCRESRKDDARRRRLARLMESGFDQP